MSFYYLNHSSIVGQITTRNILPDWQVKYLKKNGMSILYQEGLVVFIEIVALERRDFQFYEAACSIAPG